MTFREKLIALRRRDHLTQTALARAVGVTRQSVYMWEKGTSYPEAETLLALRRLFGVSIDALLDDGLPLPDGKNKAASPTPAPAKPAARPAEQKAPAERSVPQIAKTPAEKSEKAEDPASPVAPASDEASAPEREHSAPLRAKIAPTRVKSGNILDLFGSFLKRKK